MSSKVGVGYSFISKEAEENKKLKETIKELTKEKESLIETIKELTKKSKDKK